MPAVAVPSGHAAYPELPEKTQLLWYKDSTNREIKASVDARLSLEGGRSPALCRYCTKVLTASCFRRSSKRRVLTARGLTLSMAGEKDFETSRRTDGCWSLKLVLSSATRTAGVNVPFGKRVLV